MRSASASATAFLSSSTTSELLARSSSSASSSSTFSPSTSFLSSLRAARSSSRSSRSLSSLSTACDSDCILSLSFAMRVFTSSLFGPRPVTNPTAAPSIPARLAPCVVVRDVASSGTVTFGSFASTSTLLRSSAYASDSSFPLTYSHASSVFAPPPFAIWYSSSHLAWFMFVLSEVAAMASEGAYVLVSVVAAASVAATRSLSVLLEFGEVVFVLDSS